MSEFNVGPGEPWTIWSYQWHPGDNPKRLLPIGAVFLLVGAIFFIIGAFSAFHEHRLALSGTTATATVVKRVIKQASTNGNSSTTYALDYNFTTADGRKVQGDDTVDPDLWDRYKEGDPIQIEYVPAKPSINQIGESKGISANSLVLLAVSLPALLIGGFLCVIAIRARFSSGASYAHSKASGTGLTRQYSHTYKLSGRADIRGLRRHPVFHRRDISSDRHRQPASEPDLQARGQGRERDRSDQEQQRGIQPTEQSAPNALQPDLSIQHRRRQDAEGRAGRELARVQFA
jgi:hypothetical protein